MAWRSPTCEEPMLGQTDTGSRLEGEEPDAIAPVHRVPTADEAPRVPGKSPQTLQLQMGAQGARRRLPWTPRSAEGRWTRGPATCQPLHHPGCTQSDRLSAAVLVPRWKGARHPIWEEQVGSTQTCEAQRSEQAQWMLAGQQVTLQPVRRQERLPTAEMPHQGRAQPSILAPMTESLGSLWGH